MKRAIIIHGWDQRPNQEWLPWLANELQKKRWKVDLPAMPNARMPKLSEWMRTLKALKPDKNTILAGHSLGNALIMKFLEESSSIGGVVMVAAWDYLVPDLTKEHKSFFGKGFDYQKIKNRKIPLVIVQSTNDPYLDFEKAKVLARKIGAKFIPVKNAGHFMERDGYKKFPVLLDVIENRI